jgi:peptide/nickel transport system permease protein
LQILALLLLVTFATFLLSSLIPGDFLTQHQFDPSIQIDTIARMRERYGLNLPFHIQYGHWLRDIVHLDLGYSLFYRTPVRPLVFEAMFRTLWIGFPALVLGIGGGICFGTLRAAGRDRTSGLILDVLSMAALSLPSIILGLGAIFFAARTHWFPLGSINSVTLQQAGIWPWLLDRLHHLVLPIACLTVPVLAMIERVQYAAILESIAGSGILSARARGLSRRVILTRYLLKPALNPVLTTSGPIIGGVLSGSLVLEVIFAWPGLGQVTYDALFNRDLYLLIGCVIGSGLLLVAGNLGGDLLLYALDPRTRSTWDGRKK